MSPIQSIPFYQDWTFWAVVFSAIAVALSQLPPVRLWFKKPKLDLEPYSRIHISHKVGNPNLQLHIILTNIGGREVKIKGINLLIRREGKEIAELPVQNYLQNPSDKSSILFTSFSLKPKEEWAHIVNFLNYFSKADEKKYRNAEHILREKIVYLRNLPENKDQLVVVEDSLVETFIQMFDEKFIWSPGEYEVTISIKTANDQANVSKNYRFTIFESDSYELSKVKESYKSGDGINWDSGNHPGIIVELIEA